MGANIIQAIIWLLIIGSIYFVVDWGLGRLAPPEPVNKVIHWIVIIAVVLLVINVLLTLVGYPLFRLPRLHF